MMLKRKTEMKAKTKRGALRKSTFGSGKKPTYKIHRKPATTLTLEASSDTYRNCKETHLLTVEDSERDFLECNHTKVQMVNRINIHLVRIDLKAACTQTQEGRVKTLMTAE